MLMPSDTEMVVNSRGVPPASAMPALAASTWKSWVMLQGVCSPFMLTTPIIGLASAASSSPIARMKARCGARSRPSVVTRDRHFFISVVPALSFSPCGRRCLREAKADEGSLSLDGPEPLTRPRCFASQPPSPTRGEGRRVPTFAGTTARLLQRRDDGRVLELRDIHLRQHSGLRIDVEHLLNCREIRRRSGIPAEIIVLEQICIEHRDRRL